MKSLKNFNNSKLNEEGMKNVLGGYWFDYCCFEKLPMDEHVMNEIDTKDPGMIEP